MFDPVNESRHVAAYALGQLLQNNSSVEAGVRAVLRIATLRGHGWWQAWALIQLTDYYEPDALSDVHRLIESAFPDADRRADLIDSALSDVRATRTIGFSDPPNYYLADVADIERDLPIFEARLMHKISVKRLAQRDMRHAILNRIKNKTQLYLMAIENGSAIPNNLDA